MANSFLLDERGVIQTCPGCRQRNRLAFQRLGQAFRCGKCHKELSTPSEPIDVVTEPSFDAAVRESPLPVLVDFSAPWCGPCKMVAPEVAKVAHAGEGKWMVLKVNTQTLQDLAARFRVTGIPLFVVFRGGKEVARQAGALPARALEQMIA